MGNVIYHQAAVDLIGQPLDPSPAMAALLDERERRCGVKFPASVREWYSLEGAAEALDGQDCLVAVAELGEVEEDWFGAGQQDFVAQGFLVIMYENQGVCWWAVLLDGSDDPPVVVAVDRPQWSHCAAHFSTFVYTRIWDWGGATWPDRGCDLQAQDGPLQRADLDLLQQVFLEEPRTYGWPGKTNYRFSYGGARILVWDDEERQADWFLSADSPATLRQLAGRLWNCGTLASRLYALRPCGEKVLADMRRQR